MLGLWVANCEVAHLEVTDPAANCEVAHLEVTDPAKWQNDVFFFQHGCGIHFVCADRAHLRLWFLLGLCSALPFTLDAARCQSDGGCDHVRDDLIDECLRHDSGELVCGQVLV